MKKHFSHSEIFSKIGEHIRAGQTSRALELFNTVKTKNLTEPEERVSYSFLSRRLSIPEVGLKLLHPRVRPDKSKVIPATEAEKVEYGALLVRIGALDEGLAILKTMPTDSNPFIFQYQAFAYIAQWDYEKANKYLFEFIKAKNITHYDKMVATANLCEGLVNEGDLKAESMIEKALLESKKQDYKIIYGHIQMSKANLAIQNKSWKVAKNALEEATQIFSNSETLEGLFIRKWNAALEISQNGKRLGDLHKIRNEAEKKWKHWETVRDCDFLETILTRNKKLLLRLYFGTPYSAYREKLQRKWGGEIELPSAYLWELGPENKDKMTLEFFTGAGKERKKLLKSRKQIGEFLSVLVADFYRPLRIVSIHAKLFPKVYFNPHSSILRVRAVIFQTRSWLKQQRNGLKIECDNGMYFLSAEKPVKILIPNTETLNMKDATLQKTDILKSLLKGKRVFTVEDTEKVLEMSRRSANRLLEKALQSGIVIRAGSGVNTYYEWVV